MKDSISVTKLRSKLKETLTQVEKGRTVTITSHGKAIGQITPVRDERAEAQAFFEELRKTAKIGDVISPIDVNWDAEQ